MLVAELQILLAKEDPNAVVGCALTYRTGWVNTFHPKIKHAEDGTVVLDMVEETTTEEELDIR